MMLRVLASMGPPVAWVDGMWCVRRLPTACSLALRRWLAAACGEVAAGGLTQCRADEYRRQHGEDVGLHQADQQFQRHQRHRHEQRSEEHTSELQSLMRISYAVFCLKKKNK